VNEDQSNIVKTITNISVIQWQRHISYDNDTLQSTSSLFIGSRIPIRIEEDESVSTYNSGYYYYDDDDDSNCYFWKKFKSVL